MTVLSRAFAIKKNRKIGHLAGDGQGVKGGMCMLTVALIQGEAVIDSAGG